MTDLVKRKHDRDTQFAGKSVEAIVEDENGDHPISNATLVNHSDAGMQVVADMNPALARGRVVVFFFNDGYFPERKRHKANIVWISVFPASGQARFGCEFTSPVEPVSLLKPKYVGYNQLSWIRRLLGMWAGSRHTAP